MPSNEMKSAVEFRPTPDPTVLTTEALHREISGLRQIMEARLECQDENLSHVEKQINGSKEIIETRLEGMDKAIQLLQAGADRYPSLVRAEVEHLQKLHEEKFGSIATQFQERDKRTEQLSLADKTAIAAALQAQKEAAGAQNESNAAATTKMESNFTELIKQGRELSAAQKQNNDTQINDLKSRLDKGEGRGKGMSDGWGYIVGAIGALAGLAGIVSLAMTFVVRK